MLRPAERLLRRLVIAEVVAFTLCVAVIWLDEWLDLPHVLFGDPVMPAQFHEAIVESGCIAAAGVLAVLATAGALRRLRRMGSYIAVCAWCREVRVDGRWMPFEDFLLHQDDLRATHGICERCAAGLKDPDPAP